MTLFLKKSPSHSICSHTIIKNDKLSHFRASLIEEYKENINTFTHQIAEKKNYIQQLEQTKLVNESSTQDEQKSLEKKLFNLKQKLENEREKLKNIDKLLSQQHTNNQEHVIKSKSIKISNNAYDDEINENNNQMAAVTKINSTTDIMSKSFNENMFYNRSKIEVSYFDFTLTSTATESLPRNSKIVNKPIEQLNRQSTHSDNNASPLTIPKFSSLSSINYSSDNLKTSSPQPPAIEETASNGQIITSQSQVPVAKVPGVQYRQSTKQKRPLTRYLPNFSLDFNLRQHIETAGHQLQLCPHVIIDGEFCLVIYFFYFCKIRSRLRLNDLF